MKSNAKIMARAIAKIITLCVLTAIVGPLNRTAHAGTGISPVTMTAGDSAKDTTKATAPPTPSAKVKSMDKADTANKTAALKEDTVTTASGLKYVVKKKGTGAVAKVGQMVSVHYAGRLTNGKEFDNSYKRNQPYRFKLGGGQVIQGWDEGIQGMHIGEKRTLVIPAKLGWGDRGAGSKIPGGATVIFETELISVE